MIEHISAPAPRLLLRLFEVDRIFKKNIDFKEVNSVVELGPGLGDFASLLTEYESIKEIQLVEFSAEARALLSRRFSANASIKIFSDISELRSCCDLFSAFEVLEHVMDDVTLLNSIASKVKEGGYFIGSVPAYMKKWQAVDDWAGHVRRYEKEELIEKLSDSGFKIVEIEVYGFPFTNILFPLRTLYYRNKVDMTLEPDES